ncbi:hypothetical protein QE152_g29833 [Popillia japonica]|uniref:Uncharacterized protein n=1 Tax=Popillia japonica TaxID=7064 RepID=A0AAW1JFP2_POPJA
MDIPRSKNKPDNTTVTRNRCLNDANIEDLRNALYNKPDNTTVTRNRCLNDANIEDLRNALYENQWGITKVNDAFKNFLKHFTYYYNSVCPEIKVTKTNSIRPWINETIKRSSIQLKDLYALLQTTDRDAEIMKSYKARKKEHRKLITKEKKAYYANRLHSSKNKTLNKDKITNKLS